MTSPPDLVRAACVVAVLATIPASCLRAQTNGEKPVLVELFTSEGCSDCPPADDLLARIDRDQPIPGARAIVLSEHVTYWNHQGWSDPFSMEQIDIRQKDYQERFGLNDVYTPEMVVDGTEQFVGSNVEKAKSAIARAAAEPKQVLSIAKSDWLKDGVHFSVQTARDPGMHLFAALAEDVSRSEVMRGENAGRTLHHTAVVRSLKEFKTGFDGSSLSLSSSGVKKDAASVRLVVFLTDARSGRVEAAAETVLRRP